MRKLDQFLSFEGGGVKGEGDLYRKIPIEYPELIIMGKNPSTIFRELYKRAKHREGKITSTGGTTPLLEMNKQDGCVYVTEKEVIQSFMIEGYSEFRANKHIAQWIDYDFLFVRYNNGFKYIGFSKEMK